MGRRLFPQLLAIVFLLSGIEATATTHPSGHVPGQVLLQLHSKADIRKLAAELENFQHRQSRFHIQRQLNGPMNIWLCSFDHNRINEYDFLQRLRTHPLVANAQFNHYLELRSTTPDDPDFPRQWQYINTGQTGGTPGADLDMDLAWDITTGGTTVTGDTIVVCIIDNGLSFTHEDISDNLWVNHSEIPGNGFDDDNNGYVDDYYGWNAAFDNDDIDVEDLDRPHGTSVAGIIGARGNNGIGVSGLNWQVKLMIVVGGNGLESDALESYAYPLAQRRRYNLTNGEEGAFVVATNASWGVDYADPAEFPLWCAFYDTLGAAGIINIAATANEDLNVDEEGDMPTGCISDFLIGVTTLDDQGGKAADAGFGARSIDLGAYGEGIWTIKKDNAYGVFDGTSAAAPHVAAAAALLYAAPCPTSMALAQSDPAAAALRIKQYLLDGTIPNSSLAGITTTGGALNPFNSLQLLLEECGDCPPPTSQQTVNITGTRATLTWRMNDSINKVDLRWRQIGTEDWKVVRNALSPFTLEALTPCARYEFQLKAYCTDETLDYGPITIFQTDGCCRLPDNFRLASRNDGSAVFQWTAVLAAESYQLRLFEEGNPEPLLRSTNQNIAFFNGLSPCTDYRVDIQSVCTAGSTGYGASINFRTLGCGACLDQSYCRPANIDGAAEWIAEVCLNTLENYSGPNGGYADFSGLVTTQLATGQSYPIHLAPGFAADDFFEYFLVWIDLNHDGIFSPEERLFDPGGASRSKVSGTVQIPADAKPGATRMRVAMKFLRPGGPCNFTGDEPFGEIEDYCVSIVERSDTCLAPANINTVRISSQRLELEWENVDPASEYLLRYRQHQPEIQNPLLPWQTVSLSRNRVALEELSECTEYEIQVKSICDQLLGPFTSSQVVKTDCSTSSGNPLPVLREVSVYPNPFRDAFAVQLYLERRQDMLRLGLFDSSGRRLLEQEYELSAGAHTLELTGSSFAPGVYWLQLSTPEGAPVLRKVVKIR